MLQLSMGPCSKIAIQIGSLVLDAILDTGSSLSIFPSHLLRLVSPVPNLRYATQSRTVNTVTSTESLDCVAELSFSVPDGTHTFVHNFYVLDSMSLRYPLLGVDFLSKYNVLLDYSSKPCKLVINHTSNVALDVALSDLTNILSSTISYADFQKLCSITYTGDEWICYPEGWKHCCDVFRGQKFAVTIGVDENGQQKFFTGIDPQCARDFSTAEIKGQLHHHRKLKDDPLPAEALPYFERWSSSKKLIRVNGICKENLLDVVDLHPLITQWYVVFGKKARPVFTYSLLNRAIRRSKVLQDFEQRKLRDIMIRTRLFRRVLFCDLHDAYFSLALFPSNYALNVVRIQDFIAFFTAVSFGPSQAPQSLELSMGHLMSELDAHIRSSKGSKTESSVYSTSFMDDVCHMDNLRLDTAPFEAEGILNGIANSHDMHFNDVKRQCVNTAVDDVEALGVVYSDHGKYLKFPVKQWVKLRDAFPPDQLTLSYSGVLSILGKLPDVVTAGAWNLLLKHALQGLVSRERYHRQVSWRSRVSDRMFNLVRQWHTLIIATGTLVLPRLYDFNKDLILSADASKWVSAYEISQEVDGELRVFEESSVAFPEKKLNVAIVVKEMTAVYAGLAAVHELEQLSSRKFRKIVVNTDNKVVKTILSTKRVAAVSRRENCPVLQKYLALLQELYPLSEWSRFTVQYVPSATNRADRLTRNELHTKLVAFRHELASASTSYDEVDDNISYLVEVSDHCCASCQSDIPLKLSIDGNLVKRHQAEDRELCIVKKALKNGLLIQPTTPSLAEYAKMSHELRLVDDTIFWARDPSDLLPVIPHSLLEVIINQAHAVGHTNTQATVEMLRKVCYFLWMWRSTHEIVIRCPKCALNVRPDPVLPMQQVNRASAPWEVLHIDIVSYGPAYFLTIIDSFSKYLLWEFLPSTKSSWIATMLMRCFIKMGPPGMLIADNARNLGAPEVVKVLEDFGVRLRRSSEYYPKGNSIAERVHRTLHHLARAFSLRTPNDIRREAGKLVYVYNSRPHKALGNRSPFMVLFGRDPYVMKSGRYDLHELYSIWDDVRTQQAWQHRNNKVYYDRRNRAQERSGVDYCEGRKVLLYTKRVGGMGVDHKLSDAWQVGWWILNSPSPKHPNTVIITDGKSKRLVNLRYVKLDELRHPHGSAIQEIPREGELEPRSSCPTYEADIESIKANEEVQREGVQLQVDEAREEGFRFYEDEGQQQLRRSQRVKRPVQRLSFGLHNSKRYDEKVVPPYRAK